jgi:hypothetical protein
MMTRKRRAKMACTVMNLITQTTQVFTCLPAEAVVAAYAQSKKDFNTWDYYKKYNSLLKYGEHTISCGDFSVFKDGRQF